MSTVRQELPEHLDQQDQQEARKDHRDLWDHKDQQALKDRQVQVDQLDR
jgi:hypothetical protein